MADSRSEELLKGLLGEEAEIKDPQSRVENLLTKMLDGGVGGGGDWNVNDPDAKGYISNRPFYEYEEYESELVHENAYWQTNKGYINKTTYNDQWCYSRPIICSGTNDRIDYRTILNEEDLYRVDFIDDSIEEPVLSLPWSKYTHEEQRSSYEYYVAGTKYDNGNECLFYTWLNSGTGQRKNRVYVLYYIDQDSADTYPSRLEFNRLKIYKRKTIKRLITIPDKYLPQTLTLGKGTEDEVTVTATQMKALLELLNA